jgi:hypothetical protein
MHVNQLQLLYLYSHISDEVIVRFTFNFHTYAVIMFHYIACQSTSIFYLYSHIHDEVIVRLTFSFHVLVQLSCSIT